MPKGDRIAPAARLQPSPAINSGGSDRRTGRLTGPKPRMGPATRSVIV